MIIKSANPQENTNIHTVKKQIEKIEKEVIEFTILLKNTIGENKEISSLLLGWKIFYSPVIINPKILFIGINPGGGDPGEPFTYYNEEHKILEYIDDERNDYMLAKNTKKIFNKINQLELLKDAVKMNTKFYASKGVTELHEFEKLLANNNTKLADELKANNKKWVKSLIEIINPENIICEGKEAFDYMDNVYDDAENWKKTLDYDSNKFCGNFNRKSDGMNLFGYTRQQGVSNDNLVNNICPELKKILQ